MDQRLEEEGMEEVVWRRRDQHGRLQATGRRGQEY